MTTPHVFRFSGAGVPAAASGRLLCALALGAVFQPGGGVAWAMPAAPPGVRETGAPAFVVLGPEALGMSTSPIDLHLLPDGRVLLVSQLELAFGDGVRWDSFKAVAGQPPLLGSVAVDHDGEVYAGLENGFARLELLGGASWRYQPVETLPAEAIAQKAPLISVAALSDHWYWYGGNGAIVSWRPGQPAGIVGNIGAIQLIFSLGNDVFVSDLNSGRLFQLRPGQAAEQMAITDLLMSEVVTCATPFGPGELLVGTAAAGMKLFDGKSFRPFGPAGAFGRGRRITDICATGEGYFAAAVDTEGIVFFDREGNTVQELGRSLDHRLGRVQRLQYAPNGVLWGLLNDGVVRVEFPSPLSHFEPLLASGLTYAQPLRHGGELWVLADGRVLRGIYESSGRLDRFEDATPPGRYLFTLQEVAGQLFASNENGIYVLDPGGWRLVLPGIVNARIGVDQATPGGFFYVARGEYGTIQQTGGDYTARRIPAPALEDSYGMEVDAAGIGWLELGMGHVARLDLRDGNPGLQVLGPEDGLSAGWVELYLLDGVARFHVGQNLYRFDDTRRKFRMDLELLALLPQLAVAGGRPVTDSLGRLWYSVDGATQVVDRRSPQGNSLVKTPPIGFAPTIFTVEDDGVIWMFAKRRLARMDRRLPAPPSPPLRALITSMEFPASNRHLFTPDETLASLNYTDNSVIIHFAAPANPFAAPVTFEVLLEGAADHWVSTGAVGSATFNLLQEGDYVFRVRPVSGGTTFGEEDRLQFTIRPPWFRTPFAWVAYVLAAAGLLIFVTWLSSFLQRRKNEQLELVVAERTGELNATNAQLGRQIQETTEKSAALSGSEERYRLLNAGLEDRVQQRTAELSLTNGELQQRESLFRLIFEHAPVGISWRRTDLGGVYHLNSTFRRILALPDDQLTDSSPVATLVHADDAPRQLEMNRAIERGDLDRYNLEERFVLPDGRLVWSKLSVAVIRDQPGRIIQEIGILEDITVRKRAETELAAVHRELVESSRMAGMAEVATGVLHNVGNVLNSVNVSATLVAEQVRHSKGANVAKLAALLAEHQADLPAFLTGDPRGRMIPGYLGVLRDSLAQEQAAVTAELDHLCKNIEHIKDIVAKQQSYAKTSGLTEAVAVADLVDDAIRINAAGLARHHVELVREFQDRPVATLDKHNVMQILINLIRNAKNACGESGRPDRRITVRLTADARTIRVAVIDNGVGIPAENLTRIFAHGFTTKKTGHGFGLHSGALAAKELGGTLQAASAGPGLGATFILELPAKPETPVHA